MSARQNLKNFNIKILVDENGNANQKSKVWSKIEILVNNRNSGEKSKFW